MPTSARFLALPVSNVRTSPKPLACMCLIQSLQQPQVGLL
jgi:hypothetical protein